MNLPFPKDVLLNLEQADPHAVAQLADFGPNIFNPIIGATPAETFANIGKVSSMVSQMLEDGRDITEVRNGMALVVQSVWYAAHYEGGRKGGAQE